MKLAAAQKQFMAGFLVLLLGLGCTSDSIKKRYILAEKLWGKGDYIGAVAEFERVSRRDPKGKLGLQALFRAAMTQTLFLSQHTEAIRKFKAYIETSENKGESWSAQLQIGEILFSKMGRYDEAILHYRALIEKKPNGEEVPEFLFKIGRSHFFLWEFGDAISYFQQILQRFPGSSWAEKAQFEIGSSYFTGGEQRPDGQGLGTEAYKKAMATYEKFIQNYPKSELIPQAQFGIAACLEELDLLDQAYSKYESLKGIYPSPSALEIKLQRIHERQSQRKR